MSDGGAEGAVCGLPEARRWASRSLHVDCFPARARRGGPDGRSFESVREDIGAAAGRSGIEAPVFFAARLASASASRLRWMAAFSSRSLLIQSVSTNKIGDRLGIKKSYLRSASLLALASAAIRFFSASAASFSAASCSILSCSSRRCLS